jgi:hypothetical protein
VRYSFCAWITRGNATTCEPVDEGGNTRTLCLVYGDYSTIYYTLSEIHSCITDPPSQSSQV